jgi:transcriptional regulator with XRE-family HTH domain
MDDQRFGTAMRQIRIRRRLRQADVARLAGVSQPTLSRIERGHLASLTLDSVRRVAAVLDVRVDLIARWRAGDLDRLLNARHAQFHELVARRFAGMPGWVQQPEVSFAIYADRGVIDILAFHAASDTVLVIELKTDIADVNELVGTVDRKRRVAVGVAREIGWPVGASSRVDRRRQRDEPASHRRPSGDAARRLPGGRSDSGRLAASSRTADSGPVHLVRHSWTDCTRRSAKRSARVRAFFERGAAWLDDRSASASG